jgi:hypothetical protein
MSEHMPDSEIYTAEIRIDYEAECTLLLQQIAMYLDEWRALKGVQEPDPVSNTYTDLDGSNGSRVCSITSDSSNHIKIEISSSYAENNLTIYELKDLGSLQLSHDESVDISHDTGSKWADEYSKLHQIMQIINSGISRQRPQE